MVLSVLAAGAIAAVAATQGPSYSACAWDRVPDADKAAFRGAYSQSIIEGMRWLSSRDAQLQPHVAACTGRPDLPKMLSQGAIASQAIQDGAAGQASTLGHIGRAELDAAWTAAPEAARQCIRANAGKAFGQAETCPDPKAPLWFLQRFGLGAQSERPLLAAVLAYVNARAQSEWVDGFIARALAK